MAIAIASDHDGFQMKQYIIEWLKLNGIDIMDFGCYSNEDVDYSDYVHPLAVSIIDEDTNYGILICDTGNSVSMTANKWRGIRNALCWNAEIARLSRLHNDANIVSLPAKFISIEEAISILEVFLSTEFEGGKYKSRIDKINPTMF